MDRRGPPWSNPPAINNPPSGKLVEVWPSSNVGNWTGLKGVRRGFVVGLILPLERTEDLTPSGLANVRTGPTPNTITSTTATMELVIFMVILPVVYGFVTLTFRLPVLAPEGLMKIV
jgi:hypothetical protein